MRFRIRRTLHCIAALFVGTGFAVILNFPALVTYKFSIAYNDARRINRDVNFLHALANHEDIRTDPETINDWLSDSLPADHPIVQELRSPPAKDPWGNPYYYTQRTQNLETPTGVYSTGRDGTSKTDGNDPDDLNSWNDECYLWYTRDISRRNNMILAVQGVVFSLLGYVAISGLMRLFSSNAEKTHSA